MVVRKSRSSCANSFCYATCFQFRPFVMMLRVNRDHITVSVKSNGKYWQAWWVDRRGNRRARSLGSKAKFSRRAARVLAKRIESDLNARPAAAEGKTLPCLGRFLVSYLRARTDIAPSTMKMHRATCRYLLASLGWRKPLESITTDDAANFRSKLARGSLSGARRIGKFTRWLEERTLSDAAVAKEVRNAKTIFSHAVTRWGDDFGLRNPFRSQSGKAPPVDKDWRYVTASDLAALLASCRNDGWRVFLCLQRIQAFRRGEALALRVRHLQHVGKAGSVGYGAVSIPIYGVITIPGQTVAVKTGKGRQLPILRQDLADALLRLTDGANANAYVIPEEQVSRNNVRARMFKVIRDAGLTRWPDLFQVLRRNAETDMANIGLPQYVVSEWVGHEIRTSVQYYLPDALGRSAQSDNQASENAITSTKKLIT